MVDVSIQDILKVTLLGVLKCFYQVLTIVGEKKERATLSRAFACVENVGFVQVDIQ